VAERIAICKRLPATWSWSQTSAIDFLLAESENGSIISHLLEVACQNGVDGVECEDATEFLSVKREGTFRSSKEFSGIIRMAAESYMYTMGTRTPIHRIRRVPKCPTYITYCHKDEALTLEQECWAFF
jgi:hypothetical protein